MGYAEQLGLDVDRFRDHMRRGAGAEQIDQDVDSADLSGVSGTPTFFINGRRHNGAYDLPTLSAEVRVARARTLVAPARYAGGLRRCRADPLAQASTGAAAAAAPSVSSTSRISPDRQVKMGVSRSV